MHGQPGHALYLHDDDAALLDVLVRFVAEGQYHGQRTLVVATEERLAALDEQLAEHALADCVVRHHAEACLEQVLVGARPDRDRFRAVTGALLAHHRPGTVRVYGEAGALLAAGGNASAALELERLWDELAAEQPVQRLCAYPSALVSPGDPVCRVHGDFRR